MGNTTNSEAFKQYFAELSADYRLQLPAQISALEMLWNDVTGGTASSDQIAKLQRELHTLVGTAQTMGMPKVTEAARAAETCLESLCPNGVLSDRAGLEELGRLLAALKQSAIGGA